MSDNLDQFESELLGDLRAQASAHGATAVVPAKRRRTRRLVALGATALAGAALVWSATGLGSSPAFAIEPDGDVTIVTINRLESAEALEAALAEHGVTADVTFLPAGKDCAQGRYAPSTANADYYPWKDADIDVADGKIRVAYSEDWKQKGQTLVLVASITDGGFSGSLDVTDQPVSECQVIDIEPVGDEGSTTISTDDLPENCREVAKDEGPDLFGRETKVSTIECES